MSEREEVGKVAELQTRGMAAAWSRKPINLYVCLSTYDLQSPTPPPLHLQAPPANPIHPRRASYPFSTCAAECRRGGKYISSLRRLSVIYRYFYLRLYYHRRVHGLPRIFYRLNRLKRRAFNRRAERKRENLIAKYELAVK